jgi:hypothetical protein
MTSTRGSNSGKTRFSFLAVSAFALLFILYSSSLFAQTGNVNFSGTWTINESKSSPSEGGFRMAATMMTITQDGNNLTVERTAKNQDGEDFKSTYKFTLDGKECVNTIFGNNTRKSIVTWAADKKSLDFAHIMSFERDGQTNEFKSSETWRFNDTDKTLSINTVFNGPNGEIKATNVYDKK